MVEDMGGSIEAVFFPKTFSKYSSLITSEEPIVINGKIEFEGDTPKKIIANEIKSLKERRREAIKAIHIKLDLIGIDDRMLDSLKSILKKNRGDCSVYIHLNEKKGAEKVIKTHSTFNITPSENLIKDLSDIIGKESIGYSISKF